MKDETLASKMAKLLCITPKELSATKWEIKESKGDNNIVHSRRIVFLAGSPQDILDKIPGLDNYNMYWLEKGALEGMV